MCVCVCVDVCVCVCVWMCVCVCVCGCVCLCACQQLITCIIAAVYSSEYTSSSKKTTPTQPLPWCVIAGRLMAKKSGEHSKLKAEISSLKEQ